MTTVSHETIWQQNGYALGTTVAFALTANEPTAKYIFGLLRDYLYDFERCFSRFLPASELTRHNLNAGAWSKASARFIAFANQLPRYRPIDTITIDMMRFLPEASEAMAYLLSEMLINLSGASKVKYFDLGFVPLAKVSTGKISHKTIQIIRSVLTPLFASHGLEQFKNKFNPV